MTVTEKPGFLAVFLIFLRLGLTCFGGPVPHIGFFREEFFNRQRWLSERSYAGAAHYEKRQAAKRYPWNDRQTIE